MGFSVAQPANNIGAGNSIDFDGTNQRIELGPVMNDLNLPVTVMAWVKTNSALYNPIFSSSREQSAYHGFWFQMGSNQITVAFGDGTGGFTPSARRSKRANLSFSLVGEWHHVCAVIQNSGNISLYVNGIDVGGNYSGTATSMLNNSTASGTANIGYHKRSTDEYFDGEIDEVKVYKTALSVTDVRRQMCRKADTANPNLVAYWNFNESAVDNLIASHNGSYIGVRANGATTLLSAAAVGDTSVFIYPLTTNTALNDGVANLDLITAGVNTGTSATIPGTHIYRVNERPFNADSVQIPAQVNHYYGVFTTALGDNFSIDYTLLPNFYQPNRYLLARRANATSTRWFEWPNFFSPAITQNGRVHHEEYIISEEATCVGPSQLPPLLSACDSIQFTLPASFINPFWPDGSTAQSRTFYQTGTYIIIGTDASGCAISDTITLQVLRPAFNPVPDEVFCDSADINLDPLLTNIQWFDGQSASSRRFFSAGTYWYQAVDPSSGCLVQDTFQLALDNGGVVWDDLFGETDRFCRGDTVRLFPPAGAQVIWPNNSDSSFVVSRSGDLNVSVRVGCVDTNLTLSVLFTDCDCFVHIPNAFTPNGDGLNERFRPLSECEFNIYHLRIFNRWGILVFDSQDPSEAWDGTFAGEAVQQGSFVYHLSYSSDLTARTVTGIVNLLR